jgi:outer membrane protein assembly factor BamD (BamD/ComL family)
MHSKVKLSKREIKEDKFTSFILTAKDQLVESWQYLVIGAVVVVLIIAGIVFFISNRVTQKDEAGVKFSKALTDYHSNNTQVALLSLSQIANDYSGEAAEQATFMLGKISLETINFADSRKYFDQYLSKYSGDKLKRSAAIAGLAGCLEGETKYSEAAAKYLEAVAEYPGGPQEEEFQLAAFRNFLQANEIDKATARLDELKKAFKGSGKVYRAEMMLAERSASR